jgi:hypothetical protein
MGRFFNRGSTHLSSIDDSLPADKGAIPAAAFQVVSLSGAHSALSACGAESLDNA